MNVLTDKIIAGIVNFSRGMLRGKNTLLSGRRYLCMKARTNPAFKK
ncbi:MAG: hypothetical protein WKI04_05235 [Ferruginibacter sp.]